MVRIRADHSRSGSGWRGFRVVHSAMRRALTDVDAVVVPGRHFTPREFPELEPIHQLPTVTIAGYRDREASGGRSRFAAVHATHFG